MVQCPVAVVGRVSERVAGHYVYDVINKIVIAASSWFPYLLYLHTENCFEKRNARFKENRNPNFRQKADNTIGKIVVTSKLLN
jgi:hypothetical protein